MPILPDKVVYTRDSDPPGISVAFCKEVTTSPTWKLATMSACLETKFKNEVNLLLFDLWLATFSVEKKLVLHTVMNIH